MKDFSPLLQKNPQLNVDEDTPDFQVSEFQIFKSLLTLNSSASTGPDGIPGWVLKESADILAQPIADIVNKSQ
jgi:hypothetical protein